MKKFLITVLFSIFALSSLMAEVVIDGIYYELDSSTNTATVVKKPSSKYSGSISIPISVINNGNSYTVTSIGYQAFKDCRDLKQISIPKSVTSIGSYAFNGCTGLTSVTIPNSVTSIGDYAFNGCSGLTSVTIPNSVVSIGSYAFNGCTGLTSVTIPNSVTSIGDYAFYGCSGLTSITIPNSVTSIGISVFDRCTGLTSITIPSSVTSIGKNAFWGCTGLTSITIPNSVTSIGEKAFSDCTNLREVTLNSSAVVATNYSSSNNFASIFGSQVSNYILGEFVNAIGDYAFYGCASLPSITIPNSVTSIGISVFDRCTGLTSITIPNSVTSIGESAFNGCTGLTSITIPNSVTSIGEKAFSDCTNLREVTLNSSAVVATNYSSSNNFASIFGSQVSNYILGESVNAIGDYAFYGCTVLPSITIPNSVTSIGESAFNGCTGLPSITISNSVTSIGARAFSGCTGLTSVTIPNSVTSIGVAAFNNCSKLTKVTLNSDSIVSKQYTIGSNIVSSFGNQVKEYVLGDSITKIGEAAFAGSELTTINIPQSVTYISADAFYYCKKLEKIVVARRDPGAYQCSNNAFCDESELSSLNAIKLIVPYGSASAYRSFSPWKYFMITILATGISLSQTSLALASAGASVQLMATVTPSSASDRGVTWSSSNTNVAMVSSTGLVTAISDGTATITATTIDGSNLSASCAVKVNVATIIPGDINGDSDVDVADIVAVIDHVLSAGYNALADANGDGSVDVADIVAVINYVLSYNTSGTRALSAEMLRAPFSTALESDFISAAFEADRISLALNNKSEYTAFQFVLELPENCMLSAATADASRLSEHNIRFRQLEDGRYLVVGYSQDNTSIERHEGTILNLYLAGECKGGASISDVRFVTPKAETHRLQGLYVDISTAINQVGYYLGGDVGNVYDMQGRLIMTEDRFNVEKEKLPTGVYIRNGHKFIVR